ncbi:MAG TPA: histidine phosphatase family protein [Alphaproteobacteria bacterium]|nr:histidine phosphatase family protein [Alphaproteobacteria bacterium]
MTALALIRHGATDWSEAGRLQGRADPPLSAAGLAQIAAWRPPPLLDGFTWMTSPLARARQTAEHLCGRAAAVEPALIEMAWGAWEGRTLDALRRELGPEMARNEARGLDFRPPGGESPREVQARLAPWLARLAGEGRSVAAVTHKGVIRAVLALATGWDFQAKPPARLDWSCAHLFTLTADGRPRISRLNLPLASP